MEEQDTMTTAQEAPETTDGFLAGWEEDAPGGEAAEETTEATDQPKAETDEAEIPPTKETAAREAAGEGTEAGQTSPETQETVPGAETKPQEEPTKTWTLRHLDAEKTVTEQEMTALAQKGLDYDRIREKYDASKPVMELFGQFAKQSGMSVADYVAHIRTQAKQAAGMDEAEARRAVELEDREAAISAREAAEAEQRAAQERASSEQSAAESRRQADIAEFQKTFPEAAKDPGSIPAEVWAEVRSGLSLVAAYAKWQVAQAKAVQEAARQEAAAAAQNQKNAARSTGSMRSAGNDAKSKDPFLEGWEG